MGEEWLNLLKSFCTWPYLSFTRCGGGPSLGWLWLYAGCNLSLDNISHPPKRLSAGKMRHAVKRLTFPTTSHLPQAREAIAPGGQNDKQLRVEKVYCTFPKQFKSFLQYFLPWMVLETFEIISRKQSNLHFLPYDQDNYKRQRKTLSFAFPLKIFLLLLAVS